MSWRSAAPLCTSTRIIVPTAKRPGTAAAAAPALRARADLSRCRQNTGKRTIPDVSFDADPDTGVAVYDSYDNTDGSGPWIEIGGTSVATPCWAALIAIVNQGRVAAGGTTLTAPPRPCRPSRLPASDFHDITSGSNGGFNAGPGYDEVTGLGTPRPTSCPQPGRLRDGQPPGHRRSAARQRHRRRRLRGRRLRRGCRGRAGSAILPRHRVHLPGQQPPGAAVPWAGRSPPPPAAAWRSSTGCP